MEYSINLLTCWTFARCSYGQILIRLLSFRFHEIHSAFLELHGIDRWTDRHSEASRHIFATLLETCLQRTKSECLI
jgi:hypothetical protein